MVSQTILRTELWSNLSHQEHVVIHTFTVLIEIKLFYVECTKKNIHFNLNVFVTCAYVTPNVILYKVCKMRLRFISIR